MLKLGVIGTGWISKQFIDATRASGQFTLAAVYSRHAETAEALIAQTSPATVYTDLAAFFQADLDVIYIASPNSLHFSQTIQALQAGKHVIVEKPLVATAQEFETLIKTIAQYPAQFVFEAARHVYEPNFSVVDDYVHQHQVDGAVLTYMKYSSKYDAFLAGKNPNVFNPQFAGGALMDLGIYLVYDAVKWFGMPITAVYLPKRLENGIDGDGVMRLEYENYAVTLITGKMTNSQLTSEIYFGRDTLVMDNPAELNTVSLGKQVLSTAKEENPMIAEAKAFADVIQQHDTARFEKMWGLTRQVHQLMAILRASASLDF